jgi:hypothetical protein
VAGVVDERHAGLARHRHRQLMAERGISGQAGHRGHGRDAGSADTGGQDEQEAFHGALLRIGSKLLCTSFLAHNRWE